MQQHWVSAEQLQNGTGGIHWEVDHSAHPLLDPLFLERPSRVLNFLRLAYERSGTGDKAYALEAARLLQSPQLTLNNTAEARRLAEYLREADLYIHEAIQLLPHESRTHVRPTVQVLGCQDLRGLLKLMFECHDRRVQYEAQRKLYVAKLLNDIEHSRHIQDGPVHKAYFEQMLQESLWRHTRQVTELEVGYHISADGQSVSYTSRPSEGDQRWSFQSIFLEKEDAGRKIALDVLYHNTRFKRTVEPVSFEIIDGRHRVLEKVRWGQMRRQSSGSIVSKMIRKGINNPDEISDLIGAMFIVNDEDALNDLLLLLDACIGNPIGWRNVTDTLASERDRATLDRHSGRGYKVFKGDVDILYPGRGPNHLPYRFQVEIQVYTLEGYLRTVCGSHEASHLALKLRQFLYGLVPHIFPKVIYGADWLQPNGVGP